MAMRGGKWWMAGALLAATIGFGAPALAATAADCGETELLYNLYDQSLEEILANGEGTPGPRRLVTEQTANMISLFARNLVQATANDTDTLELEIEKIAGTGFGGKTRFVVCKAPEAGPPVPIDEFRVAGGSESLGKPLLRSYGGLKNQRLSLRLIGESLLGRARFRIDLKRPGAGALWQPDRQAPAGPIKGFADLHVHQASDLAFAGGWLWGSHREGPLSERLPACHGDEHATVEALAKQAAFLAPHPGLTHGAPDFKQWPAWNDIKHQQVAAEWLKAAHQQGLQLMVASVVNNQLLSSAMIASGHHDKRLSPADMESAKRQILSLQALDAASDWYTIVRDPWEARRAIARGELAVVLAIEVSDLMPSSDGPWRQQLDDLYQMGVRSIQIAHQTNNRFSGAAFHRDIFEIMSKIKAGYEPGIDFVPGEDEMHNGVGLSEEGYALLDEMIRRKMLIDLAHLPLKTQAQIYQHVADKHAYYPLFNSHTRMDELLRPQEKSFLKEFVTTPATLGYVRETGGVLGLRTGEDPMKSYTPQRSKGVENNCDGSIRSWLQFYEYATERGAHVAFASDFNGFITQMAPRFGPEACFNAPDATTRTRQVLAQGKAPTTGSAALREFDVKGLAHIGLLPAVVEDMQRLGANTAPINSSAEAFVRMWEREYDENRKPISD